LLTNKSCYYQQPNWFSALLFQGMSDQGSPPLSSEVILTIKIQDRNTHAPIFHNIPIVLNVSVTTTVNMPIYHVNATDADVGENAEMNFKIIGVYINVCMLSYYLERRLSFRHLIYRMNLEESIEQ